MYIGIKNVKAMPDYKLLITFDNGEVKIFDMKPYLDTGIYKELKNIDVFNSVRVSFDAVEWSNGADLDPEEVYEMSEKISGVAEDVARYGDVK
ncbi:MAG: DUF2442 domain-containing protein [Candidatus Delongbacteria bacterium]